MENDAFSYTIRLEHRGDILARRSQIQSFYDLSELGDGQVIDYLRHEFIAQNLRYARVFTIFWKRVYEFCKVDEDRSESRRGKLAGTCLISVLAVSIIGDLYRFCIYI